VGTYIYLSPEQLNNSHYGEKVDIYALGLILVEFYSKFGTHSERYMSIKKIRETETLPLSFTKFYPLEAELAQHLLAVDPTKRFSAVQVLQSE
jgi:serine/threonine protein kinase